MVVERDALLDTIVVQKVLLFMTGVMLDDCGCQV